MSYFTDIYLKRLNKYGKNYQERIEGQRKENFEKYLETSIYRVEFVYNDKKIFGTLERYKQDTSQTLHYLLVSLDTHIPPGTILEIEKDNIKQYWMIYYLEEIHTSGYNRYIVLKMNNKISWNEQDMQYTSWIYYVGKGNSVITDTELGKKLALYLEDNNTSLVIMPYTEGIDKDTYIEIGEGSFQDYFRVLGYDKLSNPGILFVTLEQTFQKDDSSIDITPEDNPEDTFWLGGGFNGAN